MMNTSKSIFFGALTCNSQTGTDTVCSLIPWLLQSSWSYGVNIKEPGEYNSGCLLLKYFHWSLNINTMGTLYILSYLPKFQKYWSIISQRVLKKLEYWVDGDWRSEARGYVQDITQTVSQGLPWWHSGWESACQCRGYGFQPWSGKIPHAAEQLGPWATIAEPARLEPVLRNKRGPSSERPAHRDEEWPPLAATRESPRTETKTQHSHK